MAKTIKPVDETQPSAGTEVGAAAKTDLAEMQSMFAADAGKGFEEAEANAYAIPFLSILQSGSPQCKKSDGAYVKGAEEGMLYDSVTQDIWDGSQGLVVVPCHYAQRFIEWQPRDSGGGFVREYLPTEAPVQDTIKNDKNQDQLPNGNLLVDTRNHYVLLLVGEVPRLMVVSMVSTQIRKSRNWMSKMNGLKIPAGGKFVTAPMASRSYRVTTVPEQNDQGSWFGWKVELFETVQNRAIYEAANEFRDAVIKGRAKAVPPQETATEQEIAA